MTVRESLEQILERLPEEDQRRLLDFAEYLRWRQKQEQMPVHGMSAEEQDEMQAAQKPAAFSLPNAKLRALAAKHKPPQAWYDENDKPF
jgi:hypothetical protein